MVILQLLCQINKCLKCDNLYCYYYRNCKYLRIDQMLKKIIRKFYILNHFTFSFQNTLYLLHLCFENFFLIDIGIYNRLCHLK